jgi:hypothetical protein
MFLLWAVYERERSERHQGPAASACRCWASEEHKRAKRAEQESVRKGAAASAALFLVLLRLRRRSWVRSRKQGAAASEASFLGSLAQSSAASFLGSLAQRRCCCACLSSALLGKRNDAAALCCCRRRHPILPHHSPFFCARFARPLRYGVVCAVKFEEPVRNEWCSPDPHQNAIEESPDIESVPLIVKSKLAKQKAALAKQTNSEGFFSSLKYITLPVSLTLGLLFVNKLVGEQIMSSAPTITKYRFGWGVGQVGLLSAGVGALVVPLTVAVGVVSKYYEDR